MCNRQVLLATQSHVEGLLNRTLKGWNQPKLRLPDLLIVLTGGEMAYTRTDGVKIIPIGCIKD